MHPSTKKVLKTLRRYKKGGIDISYFPTGFRLAARIKDLRDAEYKILTMMNGRVGRYYLIKEAK